MTTSKYANFFYFSFISSNIIGILCVQTIILYVFSVLILSFYLDQFTQLEMLCKQN